MITKRIQIIIGIIILIGLAILMGYFLKNKNSIVQNKSEINISIQSGQSIKSPLLIKGTVRGGKWIGFEGQVGRVELVGADGTVLGVAILMATTDWMQLPISFETTLNFNNSASDSATLVFHNENPSGMPEKDTTLSLPVKLISEKVKIELYFGKQGNNDSCTDLFLIEREIGKTEGIARATIEELLKGLSLEEKQAGYFTSINEGVEINNLTIVEGTAKIDFNEALEESVGGSCRVAAIRQQITQTLLQFSTIKKVIISIDGRTEDILQP